MKFKVDCCKNYVWEKEQELDFYLTVIRSSILMKTAESLLIMFGDCWS